MDTEPILGEVEENPLEMYLNPGAIGAYSEKDLSASFNAIQGKLRSMGLPLCGDLFRNDLENVKSSVKCLSDLLNRIIIGQDNKGSNATSLKKITADYKALQTQLEKVTAKKKSADQEIVTLNSKIKRLESDLAEKKKNFQAKEKDFESEKLTWENKYKQYNAELKKKDNIIKKFHEIQQPNPSKHQQEINQATVVGEMLKQSGKVYGNSEAYSEFMSFCCESTREEFDGLRKENESLRLQLGEINQMMEEIIKVRRAVIERKLGENETPENKYMIQVKNELLNLKESDMEGSSLLALKQNMKRFKEFVDKVDSANFNLPLDKAYQFKPDADVDEIKNITKLKDLIKNYKYVVSSQDQLLQRVISKSTTSDSQQSRIDSKRLGLLDDNGLERAKQFLEEQRKYLAASKSQFEKAKKTMLETEKRIDDEKKHIGMKKQALEHDNKMMQEKLHPATGGNTLGTSNPQSGDKRGSSQHFVV